MWSLCRHKASVTSGTTRHAVGSQTRRSALNPRVNVAATKNRFEFRDRGLLPVQQLVDLFEPVSCLSQGPSRPVVRWPGR